MTEEFDLAKALYTGKLELLCSQMQLLRTPGNTEVLLSGSGLIRTNSHGKLSFQMVAPVGGIPELAKRNKRPHGELYTIDEHVRLSAIDYRGREWRSDPFLPRITYPDFASPNWIVTNDLDSLLHWHKRPASEQSVGRFYVPDMKHLPFDKTTQTKLTAGDKTVLTSWTSDHHIRQIREGEVEFRKAESNWLIASVKQATPVMPWWTGRLCQALSFSTAKTIRPALAVREWNDAVQIGLFSGPFLHFQSFLTPPLIELWPKTTSEFWSIVQDFFEWSTDHENAAESLYDELAGIRSGAFGSIQTACLTLAVGIESIAAILLSEEAVVQDADEQKQIASLIEYTKNWTGDKNVLQRGLGVLGPLGKPRVVDRLYAFAKRRSIPESLVSAWKKLRDMKAHGRTTADEQGLHDLYYAATELLYRVVCSVIGYDGRITETSKRGWGMDEWGFSSDGPIAGEGP